MLSFFLFVILVLGVTSEETQKSGPACQKSVVINETTDVKSLKSCSFSDGSEFLRIGYYINPVEMKNGQLSLNDIDLTLVTHLISEYANLSEDINNPLSSSNYAEFLTKIPEFQKQKKKVCFNLIVCFFAQNTKDSMSMSNPTFRTAVVKNSVDYVMKHKFDCLDVDARLYKKSNDGQVITDSTITEDHIGFMQELRTSLDAKQKELGLTEKITLSALVPQDIEVIPDYDGKKLSEIVDWIGVSTVSFGSDVTAYPSPYQASPSDTNKNFNVVSAMDAWLCNGVPPNKLIFAIPLYGDPYRIVKDETSTAVGAKTESVPGVEALSFYEIVINVLKNQWKAEHQNFYGSYSYKDKDWVGFNDKYDVAVKATYARANCFRGLMFFSLNYDCFQPDCPVERFPLLTTANEILAGSKNLAEVKNAV